MMAPNSVKRTGPEQPARSIKRTTEQEFSCDFCGHFSGDHSQRMSDSERAPCFKCDCEDFQSEAADNAGSDETVRQAWDVAPAGWGGPGVGLAELQQMLDAPGQDLTGFVPGLIKRIQEAEADARMWEHQVEVDNERIAELFTEAADAEQERDAALQRAVVLQRVGQELWALYVKYGLKHRPLCVMTAKPNGNECSCGLAEETYAVMEGLRLTENVTSHKGNEPT